jgi:putative chitinase
MKYDEINNEPDQYILYVNGRPTVKYDNLNDAIRDQNIVNRKNNGAKVEIKQRVCRIQNIPTTLSEALGRRGFLGALGLGALGTSLLKPGQSTSDGNRPDMVATQSGQKPAPTVSPQSQKVVQKYTPAELKKFIIDYARKNLPKNQLVPFIAQVDHESHGFRSMEENLNYSAGVLSRKNPTSFPRDVALKVVAHPRKQEIIANKLYSNRMGNDNYESGDGYRYRGRGYIQLTGRENYDKMGKLIGVDLVDNPDLAARIDYAAQIAVMYWKTRVANKVNPNNINQVTKKISGSSKQGIDSRKDRVKQYSKELGGRVVPKKKSK